MKRNFFIILFLSLACTVFAQTTTVWNPAANPTSTGKWSEAANWTEGNVPEGDYKVVFNVTDAPNCILDDEHSIKHLVMGDNNPMGTSALVVANGGSLTTSPDVWAGIGYNAVAKLIVETGGTVNFGQHMWVGLLEGAEGTLELNGGTVSVGQMTGVGWNGGVGRVYINSGVLNCAQFGDGSIKDGSFIDIYGGSVVITGDKVNLINSFIDAGKIKGYNGEGDVIVSFADGFTTITASNYKQLEFGDRLIFDGVNDYVDAGNHDAVNIAGSELTLEAWVYNEAWKENVWQGCVINTESAPNNGYMIRVGANGTVNMNVGNEGWNEINTPEATLQLGQWHHVAGTFNAGVMTIYVDGVQVVQETVTATTVGVATSNTFIGSMQGDPSRSINGTVYDARIWNVARTADQIAATMNSRLNGDEAGLAGYWPLDEGEGQTVADLTGNSAGGQLGSTSEADENDPIWFGQVLVPPFSAKPEDYLVFDGASNWVNAGNETAVQVEGNAITLEAWVNNSEFHAKKHMGSIINKEQGEAGNEMGYMLRCGDNGILSFNLGGVSWHEAVSEEGALKTNVWQHVAGTFDGEKMTLYINGHIVAEVKDTFALSNAVATDLYIGSSAANPDRTLKGAIAEARVWNVARTHQEIVDAMNDRLAGTETGLVGYWPLSEGEGQTAADASGNNAAAQLGSTDDVDDNDPLWGPVQVWIQPSYMPVFPPKYQAGPFPSGLEPIRNDAPLDTIATSYTNDGVIHEYTAYRGTPDMEDDGNLDEETWNKIPWTLMQHHYNALTSYYNLIPGTWYTDFDGPTDFTVWFKMLHDDENIYLAIMKIDDEHVWAPDAWDNTGMLWQSDAYQMQLDGRAPGLFDDIMPQAEIGLGVVDGEAGYHYWAGGPEGTQAQLELAPGSSTSSFESVFGKALYFNHLEHTDSTYMETMEAAFIKWDDIQSDDDFRGMLSIIGLDRDDTLSSANNSARQSVVEFGRGLYLKDRKSYASLNLSKDFPTGISERDEIIPSRYTLDQNYPNPFNPSTTINYSIPEQADVKLTVYNIMGQKVATLVNQVQSAGAYSFKLDAGQLASGVYFYQLQAGNTVMTKKMMLLK